MTADDLYRYFCHKAFGTAEPGPNDAPAFCRSCTLKFHKKAISHYMLCKRMVWDEVRKEENPIKSQAINNLIKQVERHEVRGMGIELNACRPLEWDKFITLLVAARTVFSCCADLITLVLAIKPHLL